MTHDRTYLGDHTCWADVAGSYRVKQPEPKYVFAVYDIDGYDGSSLVITSNTGRRFNVVEGSHCSCYGLEDQWSPTSHGRRDMAKMLTAGGGRFHAHRDEIEKWMKHVGPK
jgi:hypothetical protein